MQLPHVVAGAVVVGTTEGVEDDDGTGVTDGVGGLVAGSMSQLTCVAEAAARSIRHVAMENWTFMVESKFENDRLAKAISCFVLRLP